MTVRISEETSKKLRQLSNETGQPMQIVLDRAIDARWRDHFFAALIQAYDRVWADPVACDEELAERQLFEGTLADGLDGE
jgi:hypothetical protein